MDHGLEDLSHEQRDAHDQEVSADDPRGVNGTGSPSHGGAGCVELSLPKTKKKLHRSRSLPKIFHF